MLFNSSFSRPHHNGSLWILSFGAIITFFTLSGFTFAPLKATTFRSSEPPKQLFDFHSGFWLNLHHYLYQQAVLKSHPPHQDRIDRSAKVDPVVQLSVSQRQAWDAAVDYYSKNLINRDLLFNDGMAAINDRLANASDSEELNGIGLDGNLSSILKQAGAVYRTHRWQAHNASNLEWIELAESRLKQMGEELAARLTSIYQEPWPAGGIRVEVAEYANWAGAYTVNNPERLITISSTEEGNSGDSAVEILFHESSHVQDQKLRDRIEEVCKSSNLPVPPQLDHVIIFYTAGEITRQALAARGKTGYVPYANRYGLYDRVKGWKDYYQAVQKYWQPYLDGRAGFDSSIANIVKALSSTPS